MAFSIKNLQVQESVMFELANGSEIPFKSRREFDFQQIAAWERIKASLDNVRKLRLSDDEKRHIQASKKSRLAAREMVNLVLPDMPQDDIDTLTDAQVDSLAAICINVSAGLYVEPETISAIAQAHPTLPSDFIQQLSRQQAQMLLDKLPEGN